MFRSRQGIGCPPFDLDFSDPITAGSRIQNKRIGLGGFSWDTARRASPTTGLDRIREGMPLITFDARSLLISGRRMFMVGAGLEYPSLMPDQWADRLRTLQNLGFNTVFSACPWVLHEPAQGRTDFEDRLDLSRFLGEASEVGMSVVLKVGPVVGRPYDGGGLPTWLSGEDRIPARSGAPEFMEIVSKWFATLAQRIAFFQADQDGGGPVVAIQIENDWRCGSEEAARKYLLELTRFARERGITVPILTSNGFE